MGILEIPIIDHKSYGKQIVSVSHIWMLPKALQNRYYDYYFHFTHEINVQIEDITHSGSLIQYSIVRGEFRFSSNEGLC